MLCFPLRQRSFPVWFGIFAILIIFIAPVISQTRVHPQHDTSPAFSAATTSASHHHHTGDKLSDDAHARIHDQPDAMADHEACGYCVLFFYTPALSDIPAIAISATRNLSHARITSILLRIIPDEKFTPAIPRAPPR
ncbi:DUF2946 domain-containing protein [Brenneria sp. 4F2]|nr:DUF2946 domain-containing protein [Brenneria bubanii]